MTTKMTVENRNKYYTYRVTWSEEDKEYVGLCAEFPSLSWLAASQEDAFNGIRNLVAEVISDMQANSEPVPEPLAVKNYKGVFTVRVTPDIHRRIAIQAAEANISINRLVSAKLAD
jgi:predicted HicB family RNase H-like nuclease